MSKQLWEISLIDERVAIILGAHALFVETSSCSCTVFRPIKLVEPFLSIHNWPKIQILAIPRPLLSPDFPQIVAHIILIILAFVAFSTISIALGLVVPLTADHIFLRLPTNVRQRSSFATPWPRFEMIARTVVEGGVLSLEAAIGERS